MTPTTCPGCGRRIDPRSQQCRECVASDRARLSWVSRRRGMEARFWARVDRSGGLAACWPWTGSFDRGGYGTVLRYGRNVHAHREALSLTLGRALGVDELACHHCDNPPCCNPAHLYAGSRLDNARDARERGLQPRGERHGMARLTETAVLDIRARRALGVSSADLAREYGVNGSTVSSIVTRRNWSWL